MENRRLVLGERLDKCGVLGGSGNVLSMRGDPKKMSEDLVQSGLSDRWSGRQ